MVFVTGSRSRTRSLRLVAFILLLGLLMSWVACGGGSSNGGGGSGGGGSWGTPTGSSTVTISATSGSLQHSTTITLNVQ